MPKITEVFGEYMLPPLQQNVYKYLRQHNDEVYSYADAEELSEKIGHQGSKRGVGFAMWALHEKGMIDKENRGRRVYFGSKEAIREFRKIAKRQSSPPTLTSHIEYHSIPEIIPSAPRALRQTLEMIFLVRKRGLSRTQATASVAKRWDVVNQTVIDKYGRQLGKATSEIDALLGERTLSSFKTLLGNKFPDYQELINEFINEIVSG